MAIIFSSLQCSFPQRAPGIQKTMGLMSHIKPCNKQMMLQVPTKISNADVYLVVYCVQRLRHVPL